MWKLEDGMLGMQFTKLAQGQPFALRVYQYQDTNLFKGWSPTEGRWIWFLVQPGKAKELV